MHESLFTTPSFHLAMLILVGVTAAEGFVALWAATSRVHWFWRALAVWAAVMALVPIRAYQPALVFAISSPLVVVLVLSYRWLLGRLWPSGQLAQPMSLTFGLRDVLLAMAAIGAWLVGVMHIFRRLGDHDFVDDLARIAIAVAVIQAFSHSLAVGPRRWIAAIVLAFSLATFGFFWADLFTLEEGLETFRAHFGPLIYYDNEALTKWLILAVFSAEVLITIGGISLLAARCCGSESTRRQRAAQAILSTMFLVVGGLLALVYWRMLWLAPFPPAMTASRNNYERIVAIAGRINRRTPPDVRAAAHAELLPLLGAPNHLPGSTKLAAYDAALSDLRELARSLHDEGGARALKGDFDGAADMAVANIRVGTMQCRGGNQTDEMVGDAIASLGRRQLSDVRHKLSSGKAHQVIASLASSLAELESSETLRARQRAEDEHAGGWEIRLKHIVFDLGPGDPVDRILLDVRRRHVAICSLLSTDLAIRMFLKQHGRPPTRLEELSPSPLAQVPIDPHSGVPLVYRATGNEFVLYSVGDDGKDNGGRFGNWREYHRLEGYDLDLDTLTRP